MYDYLGQCIILVGIVLSQAYGEYAAVLKVQGVVPVHVRRLDVVGNGHLLLQLQQTYVHSQVSVSASVRSGYHYPCYLKVVVVKSNKFNLI